VAAADAVLVEFGANDALRGIDPRLTYANLDKILARLKASGARAMLAASNLVGTALLRYIIEVPPLATLSADEVVHLIAPTLTRYLTADAAELGLPDL